MKRVGLVVWSAALIASACGGAVTELPPLGEVEIVVDTDMPVPRLVSRLRVDAYEEQSGRWLTSRDFSRASPSDWPTSFVVASPDPNRGGSMLVRLRAYLDGKLRDYRGERYLAAPPEGDPSQPAPPILRDNLPRLIDDSGQDITPLTEPQPLLTIDRLVRVTTVPGQKQRANIVLRGECVGVMADIATARTCIDDPSRRASTDVAQVPRAGDALGASVVGTFGSEEACALPTRSESIAADGTRLFDGEVCVPGGVFIFGWPEFSFGFQTQIGEPERMARVPSFRIDRNEVTVARWRRALVDGFTPAADAIAMNPSPLPKDASELPSKAPDRTTQCTFSKDPVGRETFPVTCVRWDAAQAFCRFYGGDLPYEAQWAYAAQAASRPRPTAYPWGGSDSDVTPCSRSVIARALSTDSEGADACDSEGFGPAPVDARIGAMGDVSVGLAIENLGGSASEWVRDDGAALDSICWMRNTLDLPRCEYPSARLKSYRGGSWAAPQRNVPPAVRQMGFRQNAQLDVGFRCVREASP
jgi:formylglycine-generating enzyme required for sulfatase activity